MITSRDLRNVDCCNASVLLYIGVGVVSGTPEMRRFDEVGLNREVGIGEADGSARRTRNRVRSFVKSYWSWATGGFSET
jgi:hypothetical protein